MKITPDEVITWLIVGALAGSLAGMLVKLRKEGFGRLINLGIGLVGALLGGFLFKVLGIKLGILGSITINLQEVVAGVVGALLFLAMIWAARIILARRKAAKAARNNPSRSRFARLLPHHARRWGIGHPSDSLRRCVQRSGCSVFLPDPAPRASCWQPVRAQSDLCGQHGQVRRVGRAKRVAPTGHSWITLVGLVSLGPPYNRRPTAHVPLHPPVPRTVRRYNFSVVENLHFLKKMAVSRLCFQN